MNVPRLPAGPDRLPVPLRARLRADAAAGSRRLRAGTGCGDSGFSVVEMVVLVPLFLILLLLVVAAGRMQDAGVLVTGAARDGARAASLERTPDAAAAAARQVVQDNLAGQALSCAGGPATSVSTITFGAGGAVQVTVRCTTDLRDVAFPGLPGTATLSKQASSPLEQYRGAS